MMAHVREFCADLKVGARQNEESFCKEGITKQMNNSGRPGSGLGVCTNYRHQGQRWQPDRDEKFLLTSCKE
jgi:hypothetical protein